LLGLSIQVLIDPAMDLDPIRDSYLADAAPGVLSQRRRMAVASSLFSSQRSPCANSRATQNAAESADYVILRTG
jgi:hypothetical protein